MRPSLWIAVAASLAPLGCGAWMNAHESQIIADGVDLAACITAHVLAGDTDARTIAKSCGAPLVQRTFDLITSATAQATAHRDASFREGLAAAKSAAPRCVDGGAP